MSLLHLLSYVGVASGLLFSILSIAGGLLWIAEVIEEHSVAAKTVGVRMIYGIIALHIALYFSDALPLRQVVFSICCHLVFLQNFSTSWPQISLTSLSFVASCLLSLANHFLWFFYFSQRSRQARDQARRQHYGADSLRAPAFAEVATFFGVCVWLTPLFLFLSLSANDDALPVISKDRVGAVHASRPNSPTSFSVRAASYPSVQLRTSLFKTLFSFLAPRRGSRGEMEGIIAPPTPIPSSPSFSFTGRPSSPNPTHPPPPPRSPSTSALDQMRRSASDIATGSPGAVLLSPPPPPRRMTSGQLLQARPRVARSATDGRKGIGLDM